MEKIRQEEKIWNRTDENYYTFFIEIGSILKLKKELTQPRK